MTRQVLITDGAGFVGSSLGLGLAQLYPESLAQRFDEILSSHLLTNLIRSALFY